MNKKKEVIEEEMRRQGTGTVVPVSANADPESSHCSGMSVVIPYLKSEAQGKELLFAVRSWEQYFNGNIQIVVIGDKEEWFSNEIVYIAMDQLSKNPQANTFEALKLAVASESVSGQFIWSNDDIYLVNPVGSAHIEIPKTLGFLKPNSYSGIYRENMERTVAFLASRGCREPLNFDTHTPVLMDKEEIVSLLESYPEIASGEYLFLSIYFALKDEWYHPQWLNWQNDSWLLPLVSQNPDKDIFSKYMNQKCFLNNTVSGYGKFLESYLAEMLPEKSKFEV